MAKLANVWNELVVRKRKRKSKKQRENAFWTSQGKAFDPKLHGSHANFMLLWN